MIINRLDTSVDETPSPSSTPSQAPLSAEEYHASQAVLGRNIDSVSPGVPKPPERYFTCPISSQDGVGTPKISPGRLRLGPGGIDLKNPGAEPVSPRTPRLCLYPEVILAGISKHYRKLIYAEFRRLGGSLEKLNDHTRESLSDAIFAVEDDLEYRKPFDPQVRAMNTARNWLYDDLGWNELLPSRKQQDLPPRKKPCSQRKKREQGLPETQSPTT